jgi:ubiquinone/menaquinone biosynthesis C-methylase UbiE
MPTALADMSATKSFYDRIAKGYDLLADSSEHVPREKGLAMLAVKPGEKVLILGFGTGHSAVALGNTPRNLRSSCSLATLASSRTATASSTRSSRVSPSNCLRKPTSPESWPRQSEC